MHYAVIDIKAKNGRGKYLSIHNKILDYSAERVEGIRHCNGRRLLIINHIIFYVWSLTVEGLDDTSKIYSGNKNKRRKLCDRGFKSDSFRRYLLMEKFWNGENSNAY